MYIVLSSELCGYTMRLVEKIHSSTQDVLFFSSDGSMEMTVDSCHLWSSWIWWWETGWSLELSNTEPKHPIFSTYRFFFWNKWTKEVIQSYIPEKSSCKKAAFQNKSSLTWHSIPSKRRGTSGWNLWFLQIWSRVSCALDMIFLRFLETSH